MATKAVKAPAGRRRKAATEQPQHIHHWVLESPNGPFSIGTCSCGETKEFRNSSEDSIWDRVEAPRLLHLAALGNSRHVPRAQPHLGRRGQQIVPGRIGRFHARRLPRRINPGRDRS